jgi:RND family efflux transporter MFP subunit
MFRLGAIGCLVVSSVALGGCDGRQAVAPKSTTLVRTEVARFQEYRRSVTLTGDVEARVQTVLSFRVSGRVTARFVDVGSHVNAGDLLARIDPVEQQADLDAAIASVSAAESRARVAQAAFNRQKALLANGFTTRANYDQAQETLRVAEGALANSKAQLGTARDALGYTDLRARASGVITARNIEVGQVADAAQPAFTLAQDGARDAVFDVYETLLFQRPASKNLTIALLSDPAVKAVGRIREVAPTVDPKTATVRVKVAIENPPPAMTLGRIVSGTGRLKAERRIIVPWGALAATKTSPAVWVVDPKTMTVSLNPIVIEAYETGSIVIKSGLEPGERVVTEGGKFLSPGQTVQFDAVRAS